LTKIKYTRGLVLTQDFFSMPSIQSANGDFELLSEVQANNYTEDRQWLSSVCMLSSDKIAIAWESDGQDGSGAGIYASVFNVTSYESITGEFQVNDHITGDQRLPSICALSKDIFAVTWRDNGIYTKVFNAKTGNNITSEFQAANDGTWPSSCALSNDIFAVTWQDHDRGGIYANVFNATIGKNITNDILVNVYIQPPHRPQEFPSICALSNNSFVVAWNSWDQIEGTIEPIGNN